MRSNQRDSFSTISKSDWFRNDRLRLEGPTRIEQAPCGQAIALGLASSAF
jgi:hypothetical protein